MEWPQRAPQQRQQPQSLPRRRLHLPHLHQSPRRRRLVPPSPPRQRPELQSLQRHQPQSQLPRQRSSHLTASATQTRTVEFSSGMLARFFTRRRIRFSSNLAHSSQSSRVRRTEIAASASGRVPRGECFACYTSTAHDAVAGTESGPEYVAKRYKMTHNADRAAVAGTFHH